MKSFKAQASSGMSMSSGDSRDPPKTIGEIKEEGIGLNEKVDYFQTRASVAFVKTDTLSYPACSTDGCNKKVTDQGDGWRCEKCDKTWPSPNYR